MTRQEFDASVAETMRARVRASYVDSLAIAEAEFRAACRDRWLVMDGEVEEVEAALADMAFELVRHAKAMAALSGRLTNLEVASAKDWRSLVDYAAEATADAVLDLGEAYALVAARIALAKVDGAALVATAR